MEQLEELKDESDFDIGHVPNDIEINTTVQIQQTKIRRRGLLCYGFSVVLCFFLCSLVVGILVLIYIYAFTDYEWDFIDTGD